MFHTQVEVIHKNAYAGRRGVRSDLSLVEIMLKTFFYLSL